MTVLRLMVSNAVMGFFALCLCLLTSLHTNAQIVKTLPQKPTRFICIRMNGFDYEYRLYFPLKSYNREVSKLDGNNKVQGLLNQDSVVAGLNIGTITEHVSIIQFIIEAQVGAALLLQGQVYLEDENHRAVGQIFASKTSDKVDGETGPLYQFKDVSNDRIIFEGNIDDSLID